MAAPLAFFGTESCYVRSLNLSDGSSTCYAVTEPTTKYVAVEFVISDGERMVYALVCHWDKKDGELVQCEVERGALVERARVSSGGRQPCHAAWRPGATARLAVSHYFGGAVSLFACAERPTLLATARVGEHAHGVAWSPDGAYVVVAVADVAGSVASLLGDDLALVRTRAEDFLAPEAATAGMVQHHINRKMGHRPRHLAFASPSSLLVVHECANKLALHGFDVGTGAVSPPLHVVSTLFDAPPPSWLCGLVSAAGPEPLHAAAELVVRESAGGAIVAYVSNRMLYCGAYSSIAAFVVEAGRLAPLGAPVETFRNPRHVLVDGDRLLVGCKEKVMVFPVGADGALGDATTLDLPADEFPAGSRELDCAALVHVETRGDAGLA